MATVLEVSDLHVEIRTKRDVVRAVDGVSFRVESGETLGLVGESGCGKTLTALSIVKLLPPGGRITKGSISLSGRYISQLSEPDMQRLRGNEVAVIFQDPMSSLNPTLPVGKQVAEPLTVHRKGLSRREVRDRVVDMLELVGIPHPSERLADYPHQLSGGLRQRVMIAMALINEPKILIADEPTTALDVTVQAQILSLLDELKERFEMAVLLITHDLGVIAGRADRVAVMYAGEIVEEAEVGALFDATRHRYTEALLETIPRADQDSQGELYSITGLPPRLGRGAQGCRFAPRCRYSDEKCIAHAPELVRSAMGHSYACHHPSGSVESRMPG